MAEYLGDAARRHSTEEEVTDGLAYLGELENERLSDITADTEDQLAAHLVMAERKRSNASPTIQEEYVDINTIDEVQRTRSDASVPSAAHHRRGRSDAATTDIADISPVASAVRTRSDASVPSTSPVSLDSAVVRSRSDASVPSRGNDTPTKRGSIGSVKSTGSMQSITSVFNSHTGSVSMAHPATVSSYGLYIRPTAKETFIDGRDFWLGPMCGIRDVFYKWLLDFRVMGVLGVCWFVGVVLYYVVLVGGAAPEYMILSTLLSMPFTIISLPFFYVGLLWKLFRNFETWFLTVQALVFTIAVCDVFDWDVRCIALLAGYFPGILIAFLFDAHLVSKYRMSRKLVIPVMMNAILFAFVTAILVATDAVPDAENREITIFELKFNTAEVIMARALTLTLFLLKRVYQLWRHPKRLVIIRSDMIQVRRRAGQTKRTGSERV